MNIDKYLNNIGDKKNNNILETQNEILEDDRSETRNEMYDILYFKKYRKILEDLIPMLKDSGLKVSEKGKLDFTYFNFKHPFFIIIHGTPIYRFPNTDFNIKYGLGNEVGYIETKQALEKLYNFFEFPIEEKSEDFIESRNNIELNMKILQNFGLKITEYGLYFEDFDFENFYEKNKDYFSINENYEKIFGKIKNTEDLIKYLKFLEFDIDYGFFLDEEENNDNNDDKNLEITEKKDKTKKEVKAKDLENNFLNEGINLYKSQIEKAFPILIKLGLKIHENNVLDLSSLQEIGYYKNWKFIKINYTELKDFPSLNFNKKYGIGTKGGMLFSKEHLANLLRFLGFEVLDNLDNNINDEEKNFYKSQIEGIFPDLQNIGLKIDKNNVLDLSNLDYSWAEIKVNGKNLRSFPSLNFNKKYGFGDYKGFLNSKKHLANLLEFLGFEIIEVTENNLDEEKNIYKSQIEGVFPDLQNLGLKIYENNVLDLSNLNYSWKKIKVNGKNLNSFPSLNFNKKYGIGYSNGKIDSKKHLTNLLKFLGFKIIENNFNDLNEEKNFYKSQIEGIFPDLKKLGLKIDKNNILDLSNLDYSWRKIKIDGKNLKSFPSQNFNKKYGIGDSNGKIYSKEHLANLLEFLGFEIIEVTENNLDEEKNLYKSQIEGIFPDLQNIGLKIDKNNVLDLSDLNHNWKKIKIDGKNLSSFPSTTFNKIHGIGDDRGILISKNHLANLLKFLGFEVDKIFLIKRKSKNNYILEVEDLNDIINFSNFDQDNFSLKKEDF